MVISRTGVAEIGLAGARANGALHSPAIEPAHGDSEKLAGEWVKLLRDELSPSKR
jgi:hypothetical protein